MSLQFILGRAGTGKTEYIIRELVAESNRAPLGPPIYWLVPNQATFISQRRLMERLPATARIEVLSVPRFCQRLLAVMGQPAPRVLAPARRLLVLGRAIESVQHKLQYFGGSLAMPGFLRGLDATLQHLMREEMSTDDIRSAADRISAAGRDHLAAKLRDLALLLNEWQQSLSSLRVDPNQLPYLVRSELRTHHAMLDRTSIYIDAFSSMSAGEIELVAALAAGRCKVVMSLLMAPSLAESPQADADDSSPGVFRPIVTLYRRISARLKKVGAVIEPPIHLTHTRRFESAGVRALECHLAGKPVELKAESVPGTVSLHILPDPVAEGTFIAREIRRLIVGGMRYSQIGIITNAIDTYEKIFDQMFPVYGIPYFIDRPKPVALHPMIMLARALLRISEGTPDFSDTMQVLRSGLTPCSSADIDEFENYALAHAMTDRPLDVPWSTSDSPALNPYGRDMKHREAAANRVRLILHRTLAPWLEICSRHNQTGDAWVNAFRSQVLSATVVQHLSALAEQAVADGDVYTAQLHAAISTQLGELLDAAAEEWHGEKMDITRFRGLMSTLLDGFTLRVIPPTTDQVLVTSAQRSRHPELEAVFLAGFQEGQFPLAAEENLLLSPADRRQAQDVLPGMFAPPQEQVLNAPFFDYVALTRASRHLIITRPQLDSAGSRTSPSVYETDFAEVKELGITSRLEDGSLSPQDITCAYDALLFAANRAAITDATATSTGSEFMQWLMTAAPPALQQQWHALQRRLIPSEMAAADTRLLQSADQQIHLSFSSLETYAECPLKYYFKYMLRLSSRQKWQADALEIGSVVHRVLENIFNLIIQRLGPLRNWPSVREAEIRKAVDGELQSVGLADMARQKAPELRPLLTLLASNLTAMLSYQAELARAIHLQPLKTEHRFSIPLQSLLPSNPTDAVPQGMPCPVLIEGKIDRMDSVVGGDGRNGLVIFDYKSSQKKLDEKRIFAGIDLQLIGYLVAADHLPEFAPANALGAFYQPLKPEPLKDEPSEDDNGKKQRPNIMAKGVLAWPAGEVPAELEPLLGAKSLKNGGHDSRSPLKELSIVEGLKRQVAESIQSLSVQIMAGQIAPSPLRVSSSETACDTCDFKACCPFDRVTGTYRTLEATKTLVNAGSAEE